MRYIFVSRGVLPEEKQRLSSYGTVITLSPHASLPEPISSHPDTLFAEIGDTLFTYADYNTDFLSELNIKSEKISSPAGNKYPKDAVLNCFTVSDFLFCREKSIAPEILRKAESLGYKTADTRQGYAHCSAAIIGNAVISSDKDIIKKANVHGIKSLEIAPGSIVLDGYLCGFIGGACAVIGQTVFFFGNINSHPDGGKITDFIASLGYGAVSLSAGALRDCGGVLTVNIN